MIAAAPSLHPQRARRWLLHTPQGQALLVQYSKKETPMPQVDIMKLIPIMEEALMAGARLQKRHDGESEAKAFSRFYESNIEYRKQWQKTVTDAKHLQALGTTKGMASLEPTSVVVDAARPAPPKPWRSFNAWRLSSTGNLNTFFKTLQIPNLRWRLIPVRIVQA
jgi:hypothetical protein